MWLVVDLSVGDWIVLVMFIGFGRTSLKVDRTTAGSGPEVLRSREIKRSSELVCVHPLSALGSGCPAT